MDKTQNNQAVCYLRVSTQEQATRGVSLKAQESRLDAYCKMQGLEVAEVFCEEGVSGSKTLHSRPQGSTMLKMLHQKKATHIVALKLDRLFRNAEDALKQTRDWDRRGLTLHLVDMGGISMDTSSAIGRMMLTMMAAFAEFERNLISERTAAALHHKKSSLQAYAPTPFGFDRNGDDLVINQDEQLIVRYIQKLRSNGHTLRSIASHLNQKKVPAKKDGQWYASTVKQILDNTIHS